MIVQAIGLLDDLDKELNTYAMRVREWYGWHFPEMTKIVADNIKYAKAVCSCLITFIPNAVLFILDAACCFDTCSCCVAAVILLKQQLLRPRSH